MILKEFISRLLKALEEQEVIEKIREIVAEDNGIEVEAGDKEVRANLEEKNSKLKELEDKIVGFKKSLSKKEERIEQLEEKNRELITQKSSLQSGIKDKNQKLGEFEEDLADKDNKIKLLESKLKEQEINISNKTNLIEGLEKKNRNLESEKSNLRSKNLSLEDKVSKLENRFKGLEDVYQIYQSLSSEVKTSLEGIFKGSGIEDFIYCGVQHDSLESLWEYIKRKVIEGEGQELAKLEDIFSYFLAAHNQIYDSPLYQRQEVAVGEKVDQDKHILGKDSKVIGDISEVMFRGYVNLKTGKVSKKSVVRV